MLEQTPTEVAVANLLFMAFWILAVVLVLAADCWTKLRAFRDTMLAQWKPADRKALAAGEGGRGRSACPEIL